MGGDHVDSTEIRCFISVDRLSVDIVAESEGAKVVTGLDRLSSKLTVDKRSLEAAPDVGDEDSIIGGNDSEIAFSAGEEELNFVDQVVKEESSTVGVASFELIKSMLFSPEVIISSFKRESNSGDRETFDIIDLVDDDVIRGEGDGDDELVSGVDGKGLLEEGVEVGNEVEGEGTVPRELSGIEKSVFVGDAVSVGSNQVSLTFSKVEDISTVDKLEGLGLSGKKVIVEDDMAVEDIGLLTNAVVGGSGVVIFVNFSGVVTSLFSEFAWALFQIHTAFAGNGSTVVFDDLVSDLDGSLEVVDGGLQEGLISIKHFMGLSLVGITLEEHFSSVAITRFLELFSNLASIFKNISTSLDKAESLLV